MRTVHTVGIRGAGLSGLSIARELLRRQPTVSISVFDIRPRLPHPQRTFCFFGTEKALSVPCPSFTWQTVALRGASFERRIEIPTTPYTMIRGNDFFESVLQELESLGVSLHWSCESIDIDGDTIHVDGTGFTFDCVIDAAFQPTAASSRMWQSFAGMCIETSSPVFDPTTATLMDIKESSTAAPVSFFYVLPTSHCTALVEHTTFSPAPLPPEYHLEQCRSWIENHAGPGFVQVECEQGAIPMGLRRSRSSGVQTTGTAAGTVRPATGYAFLATQRHAQRLSEHILHGAATPQSPYPWWLTLGDHLFLRALVNSPTSGGALMESLLSHAPSQDLLAFLSGDSTFCQALSVWLSAPKIAMLRSLVRI